MNVVRLLFRILLGRRLPVTEGSLRVPSLDREITIRRDGYGIPYMEATTEDDAWYAVGFCQGQDRAFQLEGMLRVVRGTLSELVGPDGLKADVFSRRVGFRRSSRKQVEMLDDGTLRMFSAFARGVNDGINRGCRRRPHEFTLLRAAPTPYETADVVGNIKLISFMLANNMDIELARMKVLIEDGPEALSGLDPAYPEWLPVTSPPASLAGYAADRLAGDIALFKEWMGVGGASNNWAVAPSRTSTGRAVLANDPHLPPSLPPHWYLSHLHTPEWDLAGAAFVGAPVIAVGFSDAVAWGMTAGLTDNTDLFLEEIGPDGRSAREANGFQPCEIRSETIKVKGGESVEEEVLETPRGPVIGPALKGEVGAISLRATWLDALPLGGLSELQRAGDCDQFRRVLSKLPAPSLNMVFADSLGNIGWQMVGEAPRRRKGWGTVPLAGWDPGAGWEGESVPFEEMPHLENPDAGFIATANNQPTGKGEGPFLGIDFADGYRLARIVETLATRSDWDLSSSSALQMDLQSIPWREMRDIVVELPEDTGEVRRALSLLREWDGEVSAASTAATVYELFVAEMSRRLVRARAPGAARWMMGEGFTPLVDKSFLAVRNVGRLVRLMREQPKGWFDRAWPEEMADALSRAVRQLMAKEGDGASGWRWGYNRPLTLKHPAGERAPLDRVFNRGPFPWGGDSNTVGQAAALPVDTTGNPLFICSLRMVVDVGNWKNNLFSLPGGQSGNPLSSNYDDLLPFWKRGAGVSIAWDREDIGRVARSALRLLPG